MTMTAVHVADGEDRLALETGRRVAPFGLHDGETVIARRNHVPDPVRRRHTTGDMGSCQFGSFRANGLLLRHPIESATVILKAPRRDLAAGAEPICRLPIWSSKARAASKT